MTFLVVKESRGENQGITLELWNNLVKFRNESKTQRFRFDGIYYDTNIPDMVEAMSGPLQRVCEGGSMCVMVLGHYRTGKTRLALGSDRKHPGLLGAFIRHVTHNFRFSLRIRVSAYEVYCGNVKDLLKSKTKEKCLDEFVGGGWADVAWVPVLNEEDLDSLVTRLWYERRTLPEDFSSSGSHLVVRMEVPSPLVPGSTGTLLLVDMAGFRTDEDQQKSPQSRELKYINLTYKTLYQTLSGKTPDHPWPLLRLLEPSVLLCCVKLEDKRKANYITLSNFCRKRKKR